jgi:integrase
MKAYTSLACNILCVFCITGDVKAAYGFIRPSRHHHGVGRLPAWLASGELVTLRWDAIDFAHGQIHVSRAKNGSPSVHPLSGVELRALRRLKRDQEPLSPFVFTSERGAPFTTAGWRKMVARLGVAAKLGFKAHPHMFRHACGFQLANQGTDTRTLQAYLGHRNIQHTVRYTELSPTRFKNLWRD